MTGIDPPRPRAFRLPSAAAPPAPAAAAETAVPERARERPRAFRLDPRAEEIAPLVEIAEQPDAFAREAAASQGAEEVATEVAQRSGMIARARLSWAGLFWSAVGGLVSLGVSLWVWRLIDDLFARVPGLGWVGVALLAVALAALLGLGVREGLGIARQRHVATLHGAIATARATDDGAAARAALATLAGLYVRRPETAAARSEMARLGGEIIDGRDLIDLAERRLMAPLDRLARREIAKAAKRVSVVTAISPRAVLDLVFVIAQIIVLIRRIAGIYSGRPGVFGFLRLAKSVGAHLAITGGMAVGEGLLQQVVGHGIAAKLSARLGEGVLNGLLTTRVGLSAMAVCRPMPFAAVKPPSVTEIAPFLGQDTAE